MSDANELRGEVSITLEGIKYVMRPSYEAVVAIERQTESSLNLLWMGAVSKTLALENAAIVVAECLRAQGRALQARGDASGATLAEFNAKAVGRRLYEAGIGNAYAALAKLLRTAIDGGYDDQGEARPPATSLN